MLIILINALFDQSNHFKLLFIIVKQQFLSKSEKKSNNDNNDNKKFAGQDEDNNWCTSPMLVKPCSLLFARTEAFYATL